MTNAFSISASVAARNPDVLTCLANLSNDEVFTPPNVVDRLLDLLPSELFRNPETTFLDPACKSGVFLREIAKRLVVGLEDAIPDFDERVEHVFKRQIFGIATSAKSAALTRRTLYCAKEANGERSVVRFDDAEGNVRFAPTLHRWDAKGKCVACGASRKKDADKPAYGFLHVEAVKEIFNMDFDVIIGNPPYQMRDGGAQASASPIYDKFIERAISLNPKYLSMIIPSRWYSGGKGLDKFRKSMLSDIHIKELHDFPNTNDCFPGVPIRGGVCYFLRDLDYDNRGNLVRVVTHNEDETEIAVRSLKYGDLDIFLRYAKSLSILTKVVSVCGDNVLAPFVSARKPFGLTTDFTKSADFHHSPKGLKKPILCYGKGKQIGYVELDQIPQRREWIGKWKVFTSRANNIGTELTDDNLNTFCGQNEICTETYVVIGSDLGLTEETVQNLSKYLQTKFVRFCHCLAKSSQDATSKTYRFVPMQDFSKPWTDEELYAKYQLTDDEIAFIESMIRPMSFEDDAPDSAKKAKRKKSPKKS